MIIVFSFVALLCLISIGIVVFAARNPPEGFEDENGFHYGSEADAHASTAEEQAISPGARSSARSYPRLLSRSVGSFWLRRASVIPWMPRSTLNRNSESRAAGK